ncbi:spore germination protein [Paenibacillus sedimenti]|uniref:Spore germination protein n=1 Tax=Paenibacillus sedimenti TaxID=2770274 RepID=A0A926KRQ5_9BACL|nr:spore germination protein [Paenibacillus sedimenti]MBD0381916.1 spore germination protein [Paenibacillus sedimenti]
MQGSYQEVVLALGNPTDLVVYHLPSKIGEHAVCIFFETLVDRNKIERLILLPLLTIDVIGEPEQQKPDLAWIKNLIPIPDISEAKDIKECVKGLLNGQCLLLFGEGESKGFIIEVQKVNHRS